MTALPKRFFTPEEYLSLEQNCEYKSQYVAGEIFAMSGAQPWHNTVAGNIFGLLFIAFRKRPCRVFNPDTRVNVKEADLYTYPDVSALCGEPRFDATQNPQGLLNPQVIFEVLSPSTEAFDRGDKLVRYRKLASLTDYVLVASERLAVEHFSRQADGSWRMTEYSRPDQQLSLASLDCTLPLAEIYERVRFPEPGSHLG